MERLEFERVAALTPQQRLRVAMDLTAAVLDIARAGLRQQYPSASAREIELRLCARKYGRESMARFFGAEGLRWCD